MSETRWTVDTVHSAAEFEVQHMAISTYRNRFSAMAGTLLLDEDHPEATQLSATVEAKSLELAPGHFFDALMGADFFQAEAHPQFRFQSHSAQRTDAQHWTISGDLTLRGVTQPLTFEVVDLGGGNNPFAKKPMRAFTAEATLDRGSYGMKWNVPLDSGARYLGEKVTLRLHIELLRQE